MLTLTSLLPLKLSSSCWTDSQQGWWWRRRGVNRQQEYSKNANSGRKSVLKIALDYIGRQTQRKAVSEENKAFCCSADKKKKTPYRPLRHTHTHTQIKIISYPSRPLTVCFIQCMQEDIVHESMQGLRYENLASACGIHAAISHFVDASWRLGLWNAIWAAAVFAYY